MYVTGPRQHNSPQQESPNFHSTNLLSKQRCPCISGCGSIGSPFAAPRQRPVLVRM